MTIFRTPTEASGGVINHGVRYVLASSLALVFFAFAVIFVWHWMGEVRSSPPPLLNSSHTIPRPV